MRRSNLETASAADFKMDHDAMGGDAEREVIAHYRITGTLGAGGMGKVYRAVDTKLDREVAIKVIPEAFAQDAGRLARFTREAKVLASLNHPNIAAIYGVEDHALVMELVEGPTLAERMAQGAVPLEEALDIARQMAEALEAAHEKGVVHRDLKPSNVKVSPEGVVKVLDFGLALAQTAAGDSSNPDNSPTRTILNTEAGTVLGTAAYMSPEQARGKTVDRRADIWAFGVVLYEMLSGKRLFHGETAPDILVAVLHVEPDFSMVPAKVRRLLRACLEKDPKRRLQAVGDARLLLEDLPELPVPRAKSRAWAGMAALCALFAAAAAIGWLRTDSGSAPGPNVAFTIASTRSSATSTQTYHRVPVISPNGASIEWRGRHGLELRQLNAIRAQTVRGSEDVSNQTFWSPDSAWIAFPTPANLLKVRPPDGAPEPIAKVARPTRGGTWNERGTILLGSADPTIGVGSAAGGELLWVTVPGLKDGGFYHPEFLPESEDFLVLFVPDADEEAGVYLSTLRGGKPADAVLLFKNATAVHYSPAYGGRVFFVRGDNLYSQKLNVKRRKVEGDPQLVEQGVASNPSQHEAYFSVSRSGAVAWNPGKAVSSQVTVFDRSGKAIGAAGPAGAFNHLRLSPDGARLLAVDDKATRLLESGLPGMLTPDASIWWAFWSPDGSRLIGQGDKDAIFERSSGGAGETRKLHQTIAGFLEDISRDGKLVLYQTTEGVIFSAVLEGTAEERAPKPVVQGNDFIYTPRFSPDNHWIVYLARERQGQNWGIYSQPFPGPGLRKQIASNGQSPVWSKDGKEILYLGAGPAIWSVPVNVVAGELHLGAPQALFPVRFPESLVLRQSPLDASRDGSRIYFAQSVEQPDADLIHVKTGLGSVALK